MRTKMKMNMKKKIEKGDTSKSLNNFRTDITKIVNEVFEINTLFTGANRNKKVTSN